MTLKEYVVTFKDDIGQVLTDKQVEVSNLEYLVSLLTQKTSARVIEVCNQDRIPIVERDVYLKLALLANLRLTKASQKLELKRKELANIQRAFKIYESLDNPKPQLDVELAKSYPITDLVQATKHGKNFTAHCPFHEDRSPSLTIYPDNHFHCFSCNRHGDAIELVMQLQGVPFVEAVRRLI